MLQGRPKKTKQTNKKIQGTISNLLRWNMMEDTVGKRMCVCMYVCTKLGHFALQQKLTEHCKSNKKFIL